MGRLLLKDGEDCKEYLDDDETAMSEVIAESMWRAMGWVCDQRPNADINTLKHVFKWRNRSVQPHEVETHVELA